jgi:nickel transport protein
MMARRHPYTILAALLLALGSSASTALAHGVTVTYETRTASVVTLQAAFETGEPMAGGQVSIYTPNDPATPWQTGVCDEQGRYTFVPDPSIPGTWEVQVRQAGHGDIIYVEVAPPAETTAASSTAFLTGGSSTAHTPLQLLVMGGAVVWGCIGTALFFARRRG